MSDMYFYEKETMPDLDQLLIDVAASSMTDKAIDYARWDNANTDKQMCVIWDNALSDADKALLDIIISGI